MINGTDYLVLILRQQRQQIKFVLSEFNTFYVSTWKLL